MRAEQWDMSEGPAFTGGIYHYPAWTAMSDRAKLSVLRDMAQVYGRDPRLRDIAVNIIRSAGAAPRDYKAQAAALLAWVQTNIYYVNEPGEQIASPWRTLEWRHGDCLPADTMLLTSAHELVPIAEATPGMRIWGRDRWSEVLAVWEKGPLEVRTVTLNNGTSFRATAEHKVYVDACKRHGPCCSWSYNAQCVEREIVRIPLSDLAPDMIMLQPERIACAETATMDPRRAYIEGLYLADGWLGFTGTAWESGATRFSIAGKDGHPKEAQKREVVALCEELGIETRWTDRYVDVKSSEWARRLVACGRHAYNKHALALALDEAAASELFRGLLADSGANTSGSGRTYSTTSRTLELQFRVLARMLGRSTSTRCLVDHGGLGNHPIYRVGLRDETSARQPKRLRVKSIVRDGTEVPCYDITTDDHYVYLPEADVTVSNCDDQSLLLAALAESVTLPWRYVLAGRTVLGVRTKYIEGSWAFPFTQFSHIYVQLGWPPFKPTTWMSAEPTMPGAPLGYDVIDHGVRTTPDGKTSLPELGAWGDAVIGAGPADTVLAPVQPQMMLTCPPPNLILQPGDAPWYQRVDWDLVLNGVIQGVLVSLAVTLTTPLLALLARRAAQQQQRGGE
jgi:transglutaminase-like putative cysteine protease